MHRENNEANTSDISDQALNSEWEDEGEESADLEQVAQTTSRKLLILLAIGALILLLIHATPFVLWLGRLCLWLLGGVVLVAR